MRLLFNIDHQHISVTRGQNVVSDSVRYLTAQFGFSEDWDGTAKTAIFSGKGGTYEVILTNDSCTVPHEVISGRFGVSVFGVRNGVRITTDTAYLCVQQSGYTPGETPSEPTPSVYEQLMDKIEDEETNRKTADDTLSKRLTAEETARTAADKAMTDTINGKADKAALEAETAAREADIAAIKDGTDIDSFADVETALTGKQDVGDYATKMDLAYKQDKLTFDDTPTVGSMNPVTSSGVMAALDEKADKETEYGGFEGGQYAAVGGEGGAIGQGSSAIQGGAAGVSTWTEYGGSVGSMARSKDGAAVGRDSQTSDGAAVGSKTFSVSGGAVGCGARTSDGFAGGYNARTVSDESTIEIDAIQLGTGTNSKPKTMQVYDYTMMDADGTVPEERLADLSLAKTDENNNFTTSQTITGTLTVNGDIVQNGASYESHAEQLYTKNDLIKTRDGAVGGLGDGEYTGIEAEKYDGTNNGRLVFDANGTARVGDVGSEQPLLTREEAANLVDGQVLVWDGTKLKAVSSDGYVKNSDYVTSSKYGVMKPGNGLVSTNGVVSVTSATSQMIDNKTNGNYPITPANLDYAVRSVLPKTADTIPSTLVANTEYYAGELAMVSFALPTTGKLGQYCFVKFDSGATATTLTVTGSYAGDIPTPVANKTYEILATWNGSKWVCSYRGY